MKLYITDVSIFVLVVFYLPLVLLTLWLVMRRIKNSKTATKVIVATTILLVAYAIPLGDVTYYSIAMAKECPKAGFHVYKTVKVDGYYSRRDVSPGLLREKGYKFYEGESYVDGKKYVRYKLINNEIVQSVIEKPNAEYEIVSGTPRADLTRNVIYRKSFIMNRNTEEIIAEDIGIAPFYGWIDNVLVFRWFGGGMQGCPRLSDPRPSLWDGSILIPNK